MSNFCGGPNLLRFRPSPKCTKKVEQISKGGGGGRVTKDVFSYLLKGQ
jgi:hypothetical protein